MKGKKPDSIAGVDLGTTNSVITLFKGGRPEAAENPEGSVITPSIVLMGKNGPIVGETAHSMAAIQADRTVREVKRMMGEDVDAYTDPDTGKGYSPVEISSFIIRHLVEYAQEYFGCEIDAVVITVPAYFKDAQREATKLAGEKAGVVVPRVINEPTAALMAYCYGKRSGMEDGIYAVIDLGGGTMDCTLAYVTDGEIKIVSTHGSRRLGGTDYTRLIYNLVLGRLKDEAGVELDPGDPSDAAELFSVWEKCEGAKRLLSKLESSPINVMAKGGQVSFELSRKEFEDMTKDKTQEIRDNCVQAIEQAGTSPEKLDGVVLVGGATRMPRILQMIEDLCGEGVPVFKDISTDLAVANGAAICGYQLSEGSAGVIPVQKVTESATFDIGVAARNVDDPDPTRFVIRRIIRKGTEIPCEATKKFGMDSNGAEDAAARLIIAEGADGQDYREEKDKIQEFSLEGLPASDNPREPRLEVTIKVDESGIIACRARDLKSGKEIENTVQRKAL